MQVVIASGILLVFKFTRQSQNSAGYEIEQWFSINAIKASHSVAGSVDVSRRTWGRPLRAAVVATDNDSPLKSFGQLEPPHPEGPAGPQVISWLVGGTRYLLPCLQVRDSSLVQSYSVRLTLGAPEINFLLSSLLFYLAFFIPAVLSWEQSLKK